MSTRPLSCATFVAGEFRTGGAVLERHNPATGELVATAPVADAGTVEEAVRAATEAFGSWSRTSGFERGRLLRELGRVALTRLEDLATAMTLEQGKPLDEARGEVRKFAQAMRYYGEEAERVEGRTVPNESDDFLSVVVHEPVGPVAAITPWNYPVELVGWKLGGALGAGCTIVVKPSEYTPGPAHLLAECVQEAGFPPGVVNVVHGDGEVGAALAGHPDVAKVAFTGSATTGAALFRTVHGVTPLTMELGGSCPMIVSRHADLDLAVAGAARRSFRNAGQICIAINRIYVEEPVYEEFLAGLAAATTALRVGDGYADPTVDVGPVTMAEIRDRTHRHVADALDRGGVLVAGEAEADTGGLFVTPAVVAGAPASSLLMSEETFGPAVGVAPFTSMDEAVKHANAVPGGLAAYLFTERLAETVDVARSLDFGNVGVNTVDAGIINAPYGGRRESGFGLEHGPEGLHGYLQLKHVRVRHRH
ncbi:aldehyde dehydrogenase family protein [Georgenia alba]|uniref:Aldehyde dehydrogenase family protein n=1 Tax=Georgenia alba TaxID=2233858 RepID=A0ABW2Q4Z8_9MICO